MKRKCDTLYIVVHVAQLDRVLPSEGKGREFDSRRGHQVDIKLGLLWFEFSYIEIYAKM